MKKKIIHFFTISVVVFNQSHPRSPLHYLDTEVPTIFTEWIHTTPEEKKTYHYFRKKRYQFINATMTEYPLFKTFDAQDIKNNYLPNTPLQFHNSTKTISSERLQKMLQYFFEEILNKRIRFRDFIILKNNFNLTKQAGLLIVKAKKYPLVVKLFMETPRSFMRPHNKGLVSILQFGVGGGATRHLLGFTRIKNSKTIMKLIDDSPWKGIINIPRKWYWLPSYPWIKITSNHLGPDDGEKTITLPGAYMIIADYIEPEKTFTLRSHRDKKTALAISNFLQCRIDPHINNFLEEKDTGKIMIIDTEHFPTLVGLQQPPNFTSYTDLYTTLSRKYLKEHLFSLKYQRRYRQKSGYYPFCNP